MIGAYGSAGGRWSTDSDTRWLMPIQSWEGQPPFGWYDPEPLADLGPGAHTFYLEVTYWWGEN